MVRVFLILFVIPLMIFPQNHVSVLDIRGFINQPTADYVCDNLDNLNKQTIGHNALAIRNSNIDCILITLDSRGGSIDAINQISNSISKSEIPVITFLLPDKEFTLSNALLIPFASSLIAIPPGKVIKTSEDLGYFKFLIDTVQMYEKFKQFLSNLNSTLTHSRRNFTIIENAFSGKILLNSEFASTLNIIDYLAVDQNDLMTKLNGKDISGSINTRTLRTTPVTYNQIDEDILLLAFEILKNPIIGYILLIIGFFVLIWGILGSQKIFSISTATILLSASFYIFYSLPVSSTSILLIALSFVIFAVGTKVRSHGLLQVVGVSILFVGSLLLMDVYQSFAVLYIPLYLIIGVCIITFFIFLTAQTFS